MILSFQVVIRPIGRRLLPTYYDYFPKNTPEYPSPPHPPTREHQKVEMSMQVEWRWVGFLFWGFHVNI